MRFIKSTLCVLLCAALLLCAACGKTDDEDSGRTFRGYRIVGTYEDEGSYLIAFRQDDRLCEIITAVLHELAANGTLRSACLNWFSSDITCVKAEQGAMDELWPQVEDRTLVVGVDITNKPLSYSDNDTCYGFDVDVASYICGYLGWSMILRPITFSDTEIELQSGNVDIVMGVPSGSVVSTLDYSPTYLSSKYVLVTTVGSGIRTKNDMAGKNLGAMISDLAVLQSDEKFIASLDRVTYETKTEGLFTALANGSVDSILVSSAIASYYMSA